MRLVRAGAWAALVAGGAAACGEAERAARPAREAGSGVIYVAPPEVRLSPAESAAAVASIQAHADSVTRAVREAAPLPQRRRAPSAAANPPGDPRAACLAGATFPDGTPNPQIADACRRIHPAP